MNGELPSHQDLSDKPAAAASAVPAWESIARAKRASRDAAIPPEWLLEPGLVPDQRLNVIDVPAECGILTARELEITATDATVLVEKLMARDYSSYEVTLAFCKRAAIAQQLVNCLSEIFFTAGLDQARQVDAEYAATGVPRGPLHGLPVSLKDCFGVEGTDTTIGYTAFANFPTSEETESEITKTMRESGAVFFCKTNVPLALMSGETYNAIFGYTLNPYHRELSSGGSSGGESTLLALRGSPLGVGTDVGGSIRIPAAFCGLYSLKPSSGRFPTSGVRDSLDGQESVKNSIGPLAASLAGIKMWSKVVIESEPWLGIDSDCLYMPWREVKLPEKLCFGLLLDDGIVKPLPPVNRALLETKAALEAAGHTVIEFHIDDPLYTDSLKYAMYRAAAAEVIHDTLSITKEPWPRGYEQLERIIKQQATDQSASPATVSELWKAHVKRTGFAKHMLRSWFATKARTGTGREMDALLMPTTPWPASQKYKFSYDNYTSLWNVLDYCGATVPVTTVSPTKDDDGGYQPRNDTETAVWENYSAESMKGCPVAVQLVGRRLNEEYLLEVTKACDGALNAHKTGACN